MAHRFVTLGRLLFFSLMVIQSFFLAAYPAKYEDRVSWYSITVLYLPAILVWFWVLCKEENLNWLFTVWALYVWLALVPIIIIIFVRVEKQLDGDRFFGPNVLKMTLCFSPVLLLLLLNTAMDLTEYRDVIAKLSLSLTLDLFDGIEMLEVVLEENEYNHAVPKAFKIAIIVFACLSFVLSPLQLLEIKFKENGEWKIRSRTATLRIVAQMLFVNFVFLLLRLILSSGYGKDASIFIAKNFITIVNCLLEICALRKWCGFEG